MEKEALTRKLIFNHLFLSIISLTLLLMPNLNRYHIFLPRPLYYILILTIGIAFVLGIFSLKSINHGKIGLTICSFIIALSATILFSLASLIATIWILSLIYFIPALFYWTFFLSLINEFEKKPLIIFKSWWKVYLLSNFLIGISLVILVKFSLDTFYVFSVFILSSFPIFAIAGIILSVIKRKKEKSLLHEKGFWVVSGLLICWILFLLYNTLGPIILSGVVEDANYCEIDSECVAVSKPANVGGCSSYINAAEEDKINRLVSSFPRIPLPYFYLGGDEICMGMSPYAKCKEGRCVPDWDRALGCGDGECFRGFNPSSGDFGEDSFSCPEDCGFLEDGSVCGVTIDPDGGFCIKSCEFSEYHNCTIEDDPEHCEFGCSDKLCCGKSNETVTAPQSYYLYDEKFCTSDTQCTLRANCCNPCYMDYVNIYNSETLNGTECLEQECVEDCPSLGSFSEPICVDRQCIPS